MIMLLARLVFQLFACYLLVLVIVYFGQRGLQYFPDKSDPGSPADLGLTPMKEIVVKTEDGYDLRAWFAPPREKDAPVIVYYHGNGGHIGHRAGKARYFLEQGYGLYLCEYRGYGGNPGSPTEQGLYRDARAALQFLETLGYMPPQIVLYGESLGSGVAVQMGLEVQPRLMILEAPFSSAADIARHRYFFLPINLLMKDRYDNIDKIGKINASFLFVHGDEDAVIPLPLAEKLYAAANHPKELVVINGGAHNDLYEHHAGHIILEWLAKQERGL